ncbi:MAG: PEP-CTERM sorting domain-containing protein [Dechloromonas sp.]|nr:PEP-CTERM sorting domain-containing protein [Dechloromonas sp.]
MGFQASGDGDQYSFAADWIVTEDESSRIPEPATLGLLTLALAGLGWSRHRKQ